MAKLESGDLADKKKKVDAAKEKQTWPEEFWNWVHSVIKWTWDALFNTVAAGTEIVRAWTSKVSQIVWSKKMKETRGALVKHHLSQSKNAIKRAWSWGLSVITWTGHTLKWGVRTVVGGVRDSWKDTITSLRDGGEEWSDKGKDKKKTTKKTKTSKSVKKTK